MTKLTFTGRTHSLKVEADGVTLVLKSNAEGRVVGGYVSAYGFGTKDMYAIWHKGRGVTAKEGKANLRQLFNTLRKQPYVKAAWEKAQAA